ncbi:hypothetical protein PAPYR_5251 [Paratrimastix pyriformis]|uniref:Uncharacterized protein n=1 Tax=Paratrimastix pyriformis TaxID=342808 RepID=A0ABQ8UKK5_9EUKA|nr:hypothetical protein PAPYR_5251 [Paratrimastix pyriformis]
MKEGGDEDFAFDADQFLQQISGGVKEFPSPSKPQPSHSLGDSDFFHELEHFHEQIAPYVAPTSGVGTTLTSEVVVPSITATTEFLHPQPSLPAHDFPPQTPPRDLSFPTRQLLRRPLHPRRFRPLPTSPGPPPRPGRPTPGHRHHPLHPGRHHPTPSDAPAGSPTLSVVAEHETLTASIEALCLGAGVDPAHYLTGADGTRPSLAHLRALGQKGRLLACSAPGEVPRPPRPRPWAQAQWGPILGLGQPTTAPIPTAAPPVVSQPASATRRPPPAAAAAAAPLNLGRPRIPRLVIPGGASTVTTTTTTTTPADPPQPAAEPDRTVRSGGPAPSSG